MDFYRHQDINGLTECISDYITFCTDSVVPAWTLHYYPNKKPWLTRNIKALLNGGGASGAEAVWKSSGGEGLEDGRGDLTSGVRWARTCVRAVSSLLLWSSISSWRLARRTESSADSIVAGLFCHVGLRQDSNAGLGAVQSKGDFFF